MSKFYEKTDASEKYLDTLTKLADLHAKAYALFSPTDHAC